MVIDVMLGATLVLNVVLLIILLTHNVSKAVRDLMDRHVAQLEKGQQRVETTLRDEMVKGREAFQRDSAQQREEIFKAFSQLGQLLQKDVNARHQELRAMLEQFDKGTRDVLNSMNISQQERFGGFVQKTERALDTHFSRTLASVREMAEQQKGALDSFSRQLTNLTEMNSNKMEGIRNTVETKLMALQEDNSKKLDQMRATVDEKLHETLEQRLGASFKQVSDRLEQVHKGLGEMQVLAVGVGDLKKVLTNVKARGTFGEIQLDNVLEQTLSPEQYERNVAVKPQSAERVDFAVILPGSKDDDRQVYLPIDAKFPLEDYQRLLDAEEAGDPTGSQEAARMLEQRVKAEAKAIHEKYIDPPNTTDFGIMFLPIEGLYAEVLRRPGLWDTLQREYRVIVTGPTTITALLNSLQMGFRTLAIQKRTSEVWSILGAVKTEFGKFGDVLAKTQKKLQEASNTIETAERRSRVIERKLRGVESLPTERADSVLGDVDALLPE